MSTRYDQKREQADRDFHQHRRSNDDAANRVAWLIGALIGLAFILPVMTATVIWKAVVAMAWSRNGNPGQ